MPKGSAPTKWSQPSLLPVHWPLIEVEQRWAIPADGTPTMVGYDVFGRTSRRTLLAGGIEWCHGIHDPEQCAELFHSLLKIGLDNLSPF